MTNTNGTADHAPVLQVDNVDLGYDELLVVMGVSLDVYPGELVGLVGGNGSGQVHHFTSSFGDDSASLGGVSSLPVKRCVGAARTRWPNSVSRTSRWGGSFFRI